MYPLYFLLIAILGAILHIIIFKTAIVYTLLLYFLIVNCGFQGIFSFLGHFYYADQTAKNIGWSIGSPFQTEIAFSNLAFGILGILCIWFRGNFWDAVVIGKSIFLWGAAYVHIKDLVSRKNKYIYNAGPVLYFDLLFPIVLIVLLILYKVGH